MEAIPSTLRKLLVPLDGLTTYSRNPRKGDLELLKESLKQHGQFRPLVVRAGSNEILAGNGTAEAARQLGWTEIAVTFVDVDDDEAARIVLIDNRTADRGGYDQGLLADLLQSLPEPTRGTGYSEDSLKTILAATDRLGPEDVQEARDAMAPGEGNRELRPEPNELVVRYGTQLFHLEEDEADQLRQAIESYVSEFGTLYGFFLWVLGGGSSD
jgi:hypothetical protein